MSEVKAIVLRRTVNNISELTSGALVLNNYQWGLAVLDETLVTRDHLGNFHYFPGQSAIEDLIASESIIKAAVATFAALPSGDAVGTMRYVTGESIYYFYNGSAWKNQLLLDGSNGPMTGPLKIQPLVTGSTPILNLVTDGTGTDPALQINSVAGLDSNNYQINVTTDTPESKFYKLNSGTNVSDYSHTKITASGTGNNSDLTSSGLIISILSGNYPASILTATDLSFSGTSIFTTMDTKIAAHVALSDPHTQYILESREGVALGISTLDSGAKVPLIQLPDSILGQVEYQGLWDATTNTPTLANPGSKGHYYVVSVAGTQLGITFAVGDWAISDGTAWGKVDNTDAVTTVFGRLGAVVANSGDYNLDQISDGATYKRLTITQVTDLTDAGDSALHYHAADRARGNHSGTQLASTISDFSTAATAAVQGQLDDKVSKSATSVQTVVSNLKTRNMYLGTSGTAANEIMLDTVDGADNQYLMFRASGTGTGSGARGAMVFLAGNEYPTLGGNLQLQAGLGIKGDLELYTNDLLRFSITKAGLINVPVLTASKLISLDASKNLVSTTISDNGTLVSTTIPIESGIAHMGAHSVYTTFAQFCHNTKANALIGLGNGFTHNSSGNCQINSLTETEIVIAGLSALSLNTTTATLSKILNISGLTASKLISTDASKNLVSYTLQASDIPSLGYIPTTAIADNVIPKMSSSGDVLVASGITDNGTIISVSREFNVGAGVPIDIYFKLQTDSQKWSIGVGAVSAGDDIFSIYDDTAAKSRFTIAPDGDIVLRKTTGSALLSLNDAKVSSASLFEAVLGVDASYMRLTKTPTSETISASASKTLEAGMVYIWNGAGTYTLTLTGLNVGESSIVCIQGGANSLTLAFTNAFGNTDNRSVCGGSATYIFHKVAAGYAVK